MSAVAFARRIRMVPSHALILAGGLALAEPAPADQLPSAAPAPVVTNILQITRAGAQLERASHFIRLEGNVLWSNPSQGRLVLQDASGAAELELNPVGPAPSPGQRVRLEGNGTIVKAGAAFCLGARGSIVDNDGLHGMIEKSGAVYLSAGRQPLRVEWFNDVFDSGLEVEYEGPGLARQKIPGAALFRRPAAASDGATNWANGLEYRCYEVAGSVLPDFDRLLPAKTGTAPGFDIRVAARSNNVALLFLGWLEVPRAGLYTFHLQSDDGSRLFVGGSSLRLETIGPATFPEPKRIAIGQTLREGEDGLWAEVEGKVTFVREEPPGLALELSAGAGRLRVEVAQSPGWPPERLLNRRIRALGFCQGARTTDGQTVPGVLLVPGGREMELIEAPSPGDTAGVISSGESLLVLSTAAEVHRLKREEAERGYPVKLRGVVTCVFPELQAVTVQDATRGLYVVDLSTNRSAPPRIGEFLEVEGTTDPSKFAPIINARRLTSVGEGQLPDPVRPTWDQLMNGSLDAQYVEIQGIVTAVQTNTVTLLVRGGVVRAELRVNGMKPEDLRRYEDALVRVRGCFLAMFDSVTHQVRLGEVRVYGADIFVDQAAPADLFSTPSKTATELRQFDPQAGVFQRVQVSGQVVFAHETEFSMMQDGHGVRFVTKQPAALSAGDEVDVVGFPELFSSASPVLREAVVRKTGRAALPEPRKLLPEDLINADHDSTRVRVEGKLVNQRTTQAGQELEMQSGVRSFVARLNAAAGPAADLPVGSKLELTGVYLGRGGNRAAGQDIASFEVMLGSAADIRVLARPPWWTLERLLVALGALVCVLAVTVLWITQLHRKVEERTAELEQQIHERQQVEQQRALEQERARIAQDLHDELGSGITEISMLAARAKSASTLEDKRSSYLDQAGDKARQMVTALDEIVWAMNPQHDSLASLVSYFCLYADRFLGLAGIAWRFDGPVETPELAMGSRRRHQLFLVFKEALTNIVRHSGATEVRLVIHAGAGRVRLTVADNGRGLPAGGRTEEMNGVANMRARIEKLGGHFEISTDPGRGATLRLNVPTN